MDGCIYRTKDGECDLYAEGGKYQAFCDMENCKDRKPSNADRIRAMSDEELAKLISGIEQFALAVDGAWSPEQWLNWLKEEAEGESDE